MTKNVVALAWTQELEAPVIVASGKARIADRMLEIAAEYGIKTITDPVLANILSDKEIGSFVPPETWRAVAGIFSFLDEGIQKRWFT